MGLRHTFASRLITNGENPKYVSEQMGHASIAITVDIYGHLIPGGNRQAVDKLDIRLEENLQSIDTSISQAGAALNLETHK